MEVYSDVFFILSKGFLEVSSRDLGYGGNVLLEKIAIDVKQGVIDVKRVNIYAE